MPARRLLPILLAGLAVVLPPSARADDARLTPLLGRDLPDLPGKEGVMLTVEYAPGASTPAHRHNADTFVYVIEGTIVMQVKGGQEVRLGPGQTFYEGPSDVHSVSRNASATERAKFLVVFVKDKGAPPLVPAE